MLELETRPRAAHTRRNTVVHMVSSLALGGAERVVLDLARLQVREGLTVRIVSLNRDTDFLVPEARELGAEVISLKRWPTLWGRLKALWGAVGGGRAAVVHVHSPFALWNLAPLLPLLRAPVIYTRHGVHPLVRAQWRVLHAWARFFVSRVTFVSHEGHRVFERRHGRWRAPHLVIENGVRLDVPCERRPNPNGRLRLGSVGRLVELKGQRFLLEGVAALPPDQRERVEVHLFGDGPEREGLEALAAERLPGVPVIFHGAVSDRERIYESTDLLVVTSRTEGLSLAIMESMAHRIPVVATDVGGNPSLVKPEETGLLVPYGDAQALAGALSRMVSDPALRERLARGGRALMERDHSLEETAARYLDLYGLTLPGG